MKKKHVMRLLAMVIAASVAVTSPSLPASLTTVYAATAMTGTAAIKVDNSTESEENLKVGAVLSVEGITSPSSDFSYKWYTEDNLETPIAETATCTLGKAQVGKKIKVVISHNNYEDATATTTNTVANKYAVTAVTTSERNITATVTNNSDKGKYEYSIDGGENWKDPATGDSVSGTTLTIAVAAVEDVQYAYAAEKIKVRVKDTEDSATGEAVTSGQPLTAALTGTVKLTVKRNDVDVTSEGTYKVGDVLEASVDGKQSDAEGIKYKFVNSNSTTTVQDFSTTSTYTLKATDVGYTITVSAQGDGTLYTGTLASTAVTTAVAKAPAQPLTVNDVKKDTPAAEVNNNAETKYTYSPKQVTGQTVKYAFVEGANGVTDAGTSWVEYSSISGSWTSFDPGKTYTFFAQRVEDETTGNEAGTAVSWEVTFPKLQHETLTLNYTVTTDGENDRKVSITEVTGAEYTFDGTTYAATHESTFTGAKDTETVKTIGIRYAANDLYESQGDPITATIDVSLDKQDVPSAATVKFVPNTGTNKYNLSITPAAGDEDKNLEYSVDGATFTDKATLEKVSYEPGASVVVYARVAAVTTGEDKKLASNATPSSPAAVAPAAAAAPTISAEDTQGATGKKTVTITKTTGNKIYYTTDGSTPSATNGEEYTKAFDVTLPAVVKAVVWTDDNTILSDVTIVSYLADGTTVEESKDETGSTDKDDTTTENKKDETTTVTDTETGVTLKTNADGTKQLLDEDGKVVTGAFKEVNGKTYYANADGEVVTGKIFSVKGSKYYATTSGVVRKGGVYNSKNGGKIYATKSGKLLVSASVEVDGIRYVANAKGELVKSGLTTTAKGYTYYMKNFAAVKNEKFTAKNGKTYIAQKNGVIAKGNKIVKFQGKQYYVQKTGVVAKNKTFKIGNKTYVAQKSGIVAKSKKYTIGKKTYTTNSKGVVTKVTTAK